MKRNLENVEVYTSIDKSSCQVINLRKSIANLIYNQGNGLGLEGTALATKMWNGDADTEYNEREVEIIRTVVERCCAPCVIEAVECIFTDSKEENK
nr:MAG TPA: hypothetical protein [Bacteriophage sp.]